MRPLRRSHHRSGFTLGELLVVIGIIAVIKGSLPGSIPKTPKWLDDMTFDFSARDWDLVNGRVAPPELDQSPLPAIPGTYYGFYWSVKNERDTNGLSAPIDIGGLGTTRMKAIPGNTFGTFGGTLKVERVGEDLLLTSTGDGFLTLDLVDLPFPHEDDVFPPPAFGDEYNQLENLTGFSVEKSFLISSTELAETPTLEEFLRQNSPRLITQTGSPVDLNESNFGTSIVELQAFSAVPEPATWMIFAVSAGVYATWRAATRRTSRSRLG